VGNVVMRDTRWPAGTPCWVELSVDDVPKAAAFYQALFGWDVRSSGPEPGRYAICHSRDRIVAALSPKSGTPDCPAAWLTYLATDDVDEAAGQVTAAGGRVAQDPADVGPEGRMAVAVDPVGVTFGLWQGGRTTGIGLANVAGALTWNEHMSWDFDQARAFYRAVFGYDLQDMSQDGFRYATLMIDAREVGGIGQWPDGTPASTPATWSVYFAVPDTDAAVAAVTGLGGTAVVPPRDSPYGRIGVVTDNQGAVFSLISSPEPAGPELA
jgi:predicted enzyme related to lactoylglutathione lyase